MPDSAGRATLVQAFSVDTWLAASGDAGGGKVLVLALFADDDPCARAQPDLQFQKLGQSTIVQFHPDRLSSFYRRFLEIINKSRENLCERLPVCVKLSIECEIGGMSIFFSLANCRSKSPHGVRRRS
jgi:hypothetical protein